ncbi:facilitated trehalose transporter Tret1-like [Athalia rosae]|uniref:facilitated trehalose transporter Tret1-like n=1 Tax=Athalia rosae TaxID=37344 RepID=UPI0020332E0F|nr:facilitated trehalose transporter Tret1-like [Athalia rosae]XP_048516313.1 facilitated trehalose transporter Tret1-like [Athalia rosae]XP_048516314.1 facilitated trehalose transporter Tret1-like [Athalia rosae]
MVGGGAPVQQLLPDSIGQSSSLREGRKLYQYLAAGVAGLLALQVGIVLAWTSPMLPYLTSEESFVTVTDEQSSWITSLAAIGGLLGALPAGKLADSVGRRRSMLVMGSPFLLSWILLVLATDIWSLYAARLIAGIGSGANCVLSLMYVGEIAETSVRGTLSSTFAVLIACGILYAYAAGSMLSYRIFATSCGVLILVFFVLSPFLTESPTWLVQRSRKIEANEALLKLRGPEYDTKAEIALLQSHAVEQESKKGGIRDLVGTRAGRKAMTTCLGLMFFQQLSGIDAVLSYTVSIFQMAGSTIEPFVATVIIGLVEVVMSVTVVVIIDRVGRRPLLIISGTIMAMCLAILGYYFKLKNSGTDVSGVGWIPLVSLTVYNVVFSIGYGSIPWTMISELFPPETKGVASSISLAVNWALVFAVTKLFPTMIQHLGESVTFWIFAALMILATLFSLLVVPETKGKSLDQIQSKLSRGRTGVSLHTFGNAQGVNL